MFGRSALGARTLNGIYILQQTGLKRKHIIKYTYTSPRAYSNSSGSVVLGGSRIRASAVSDSTVNARGAFGCCFFDSEA